ncbi:hypothetical protein FEAC_26170 [Ferrimicrobium acidiphilum DSM 19497]|uniref:Uncharacterized protein n=1 Tax=Ferrimicrobium acidiphilum DSM 19497 TaxID=1121877 RepID=A0A0D8FTS5_9ACTN|nr:hypothetical protein FEAC_26170 [Ferrimicrobium acidiphilum DSM 19497]
MTQHSDLLYLTGVALLKGRHAALGMTLFA